jgi:hypothetical protein
LEKLEKLVRQIDGQTDGKTDRQTDRQTDRTDKDKTKFLHTNINWTNAAKSPVQIAFQHYPRKELWIRQQFVGQIAQRTYSNVA